MEAHIHSTYKLIAIFLLVKYWNRQNLVTTKLTLTVISVL